MSSTTRAGSYRVLLNDRPLRRAFMVGLAGRSGYALLPLCLLFSIADSSGSFAVAATATAVFGIGGLVMPVQARLLDRLGQPTVLPLVGLWFTAFLAVAASSAATGVQPAAFWIALCLAGGVGAPSLGPAMRAQWREATPDDQREPAYALDAMAEEVLFLVGPLAASVILFVGQAWWGVAATAVLMPIGIAGLVRSPYTPQRQPAMAGVREWMGPFRRSGFRRLMLMMALVGLSASAWLTVLAGLADAQGRASVVGLVEAATGAASVLGALWWGRRSSHLPWPKEVSLLVAAYIPLAAICLMYPSLWTIAVTLSITGLVMAPIYVVAYAASDHETDARHHTEASTWVNSVTNVGTSLGAVAAAWLYTHTGPAAVFVAIFAALLLLLAAAAQTRERSDPDTVL
ncbi:MFS transporter [Nocardioides pinisoli]|uniref:MFS transporter n=1 Tax=Nocardioides pinisoli TaxID=2950279 RepID=A0ABT1KXM0_9ACTN|nr:MFS transporter [Nocardioides pinisoli]MCP3422382.1 MFS transporter [Nocardioides pinisoli]